MITPVLKKCATALSNELSLQFDEVFLEKARVKELLALKNRTENGSPGGQRLLPTILARVEEIPVEIVPPPTESVDEAE